MSTPVTAKTVFFSVVYVILLILFFLILDVAIGWFFYNIVFRMLDWFNGLSFFWKFMLILIEAGIVLGLVSALFNFIAVTVSHMIFRYFPLNWFTLIAGLALALINTILNVIGLWKIPEHYNFWIVLELLILSFFLWSVNFLVVEKEIKSKVE